MVTTGAISRAKLQSNRHRQQITGRLFTGRMPLPVAHPTNQSQRWFRFTVVIVSIALASHLSEVNVGDKCMSLWITGCTRTCGDHLLSLLLLRERLLIPAVDIVLRLESDAGCQVAGESEGRREGRRLPCPAAGTSPFPSPTHSRSITWTHRRQLQRRSWD